MGRDKASLPFRGRPLVEHVASVLGECVERVRLVGRPGSEVPTDLPWIEDRDEIRAPLIGIHAALSACEASAVLVCACDMPLIDPRLVFSLLGLVTASDDGAAIVAPEGPRGPEPLLAIYKPRLLPEIERRIAAKELQLMALLRDSDTLLVPESDLRAVDPELRSFRNLNREQDLETLESDC